MRMIKPGGADSHWEALVPFSCSQQQVSGETIIDSMSIFQVVKS